MRKKREDSVQPDPRGIPHTRIRAGILVHVRVDPRSPVTRVVSVAGGILKVKLTAPPVKGAANRQLIEVLADLFGVKKSEVRIVRGASSRNKVVEISGA